MTDTDARVAREIAIDELKTTNKYEALADAADDPKVKDVVRDIAREEKVHTGEAAAILDKKDEEATPAMKEGLDEAREMLKSIPSFAELFVNERGKVLEKTGMLTDEGLNEFKERMLAKAEPSLRAQTKAMEQQIAAEESADRPHRGKLALPASWDMSSDHENKGDQNRKGYHNTADNKAPRPADIQEPLTEGLEASSQGLGMKERDALVENRMKNNALAAEEANERFKQAFMSLRR